MKLYFTAIILFFATASFAQKAKKTETPFHTINRIFSSYIKYEESVDSEDNKNAMTKALSALQLSSAKTELNLLINVWMYYDPTDYPTRDLINPIFKKNKGATIYYIDRRIKNKKSWEGKDTFSDLIALKKELQKPT